MKTNHDGTITLIDVWTACSACGKRVTGDSIHTCSPQLKQLTDEEIMEVANEIFSKYKNWHHYQIDFARAILRKASEK
jgi:hypothetical protein